MELPVSNDDSEFAAVVVEHVVMLAVDFAAPLVDLLALLYQGQQ